MPIESLILPPERTRCPEDIEIYRALYGYEPGASRREPLWPLALWLIWVACLVWICVIAPKRASADEMSRCYEIQDSGERESCKRVQGYLRWRDQQGGFHCEAIDNDGDRAECIKQRGGR